MTGAEVVPGAVEEAAIDLGVRTFMLACFFGRLSDLPGVAVHVVSGT